LLELWLLIEVGRYIGSLNTILVILFTGLLGASLARSQGLTVVRRMHIRLNQGELPGNELIDGGLVLVGAAVLITPGLITDVVGFFLVLPFTRRVIREFLKGKLMVWMGSGVTTFRIYR